MAYLNNELHEEKITRALYLKQVGFRTFDVLASLSGLIILSPLLLIIAILIKATSSGPVFFRQKRYGLNQKTFQILKFRSMTANASNATFAQCTKDDPRVTKIGRVLRKFSLDELAQLYNVLLGDMSIVGPRPHPIEMDDQYLNTIENYATRFGAKPGITGLAQIRGYRGPTDTDKKILNRFKSDVEYVIRKSVFTDIRIIVLTLPALIKPQNAF